ncbi:hypothetical protein LC085_01870 [Bacillus tianshenii]|uniref:hypothetical protein n=1 Tax=Sutcliffiella tianshenii TaxID=1463404 RepID=UPI001CD4F571|nr:hypothetical protein [Bacillus tianshenii]MCA1318642.1 hypothetical protein [Bacillus tianshenii]
MKEPGYLLQVLFLYTKDTFPIKIIIGRIFKMEVGRNGVTIIISAVSGLVYLILVGRLLPVSERFMDKKGVKDNCLRMLPISVFIFLSGMLLAYFVPEVIKDYTRIFKVFAFLGGFAMIYLPVMYFIVRPIYPKFYDRMLK